MTYIYIFMVVCFRVFVDEYWYVFMKVKKNKVENERRARGKCVPEAGFRSERSFFTSEEKK